MSAVAAHMKLATTQDKSSFLPQPFCCSSVLAILQPGTPGRSRYYPTGRRQRLPETLGKKGEKRAKVYRDSHSRSVPSSCTPCPGQEAHGVAQSGQPVPSRLESDWWPEGLPWSTFLRQPAKARLPSAQTVPRDCSFEAHHGKPAPTERVGSRPTIRPPRRQGESYH